MNHSHDHSHHLHHGHNHAAAEAQGHLRFVFFLNLIFALVELAGGIWTNSIAVTSGALHDIGDSVALGMAWFLEKLSGRARDPNYSYGYRRYSPLGAIVQCAVMVVGALVILAETIPRLLHPQPVHVPMMIVFAIFGIAVNGLAVLRLHHRHSLNETVAKWHLLEDVLNWISVLIVAAVMLKWNLPILDPLLSLIILIWVMWNVINRFKESIQVFLQAVPGDLDMEAIRAEVLRISGASDMHHTHLWSLDGQSHILTAHVVLPASASKEDAWQIKSQIKECLHQFAIQDATIEIEFEDELCATKDCEIHMNNED